MPKALSQTPLSAAEQKLLAFYSLVMVKDVEDEGERKALRKARKHRKAINKARKAGLTAAKQTETATAKRVNAKADAAEGKTNAVRAANLLNGGKKAAKTPKRSRKIRKTLVAKSVTKAPSDATVAAFRANGGKVTRVPRGERAVSKDEMAAALRGETVEQIEAERELADTDA